MAIYGRRQPHAPVILRGGQSQPPVGRVLVAGQKAAQAAADRAYRRGLTPVIIRRAGPPPAAARALLVPQAVRAAADRFFRRSFAPLVSKAPPPPVASAPPVGRVLVAGQKTAQLAADRFFRRQFPPTLKRAGGPPAVGRALLVQARPAYLPARRPVLVSNAPPPASVTPSSPRWSCLVVGQRTSQAAADRAYRRALAPVLVSKAPPAPAAPTAPVAAALVFGQKASQAAADRAFRRALKPFVGRAGGRPAVAHAAVTRAAPAPRQGRAWAFVSKPPPAPVQAAPPVGRALVAGQRTSQAAADRAFRRSFPPTVKRAGGQPARGRSLVAGQKTSQHAADRHFRRAFAPLIKRAGGPAPVGRALVFGAATAQALADRFFRRAFRPLIMAVTGGAPRPGAPLPLIRCWVGPPAAGPLAVTAGPRPTWGS